MKDHFLKFASYICGTMHNLLKFGPYNLGARVVISLTLLTLLTLEYNPTRVIIYATFIIFLMADLCFIFLEKKYLK